MRFAVSVFPTSLTIRSFFSAFFCSLTRGCLLPLQRIVERDLMHQVLEFHLLFQPMPLFKGRDEAEVPELLVRHFMGETLDVDSVKS